MSTETIHIETLGSGPDLVLLHGWAMHSGVWKGVRDLLALRFRVHLLDLPGHGFSSACKLGNFDHVVHIIQDRLPENSIICGWSLGGQIAIALALNNPARVNKLVLVSTTPCFVKRHDWPWGVERKFLKFFLENLHQNYRTSINRFLTLQINGGSNVTDTLAQLREYVFEREQPNYNTLQEGLLILQTNDMRENLHRVEQPVLLLHGENDVITDPCAADWMHKQLENSKLVLFPRCGHAPFLTDPETFVACLNE
ncbi:carboxylesterase BioH (pimeloyl-CoA synthesis) [Nitrosomonas aestuarii]|uniref:Pimeloyl-[acyl-carrier protein] methyl ester esterase n=1 Tax=Nitrosomonas aestuarii TaxID=52441 RepID=A0A1I3ZEA4_9PROT|nr:pimeloyl-ACP methyl ester esterase BioH [Nitrosomonas aestuarii]SFK42322.1 carboxylesterase BioH (pimeloyl-CoA synthesis) [Nitrosomonas aestuarii]